MTSIGRGWRRPKLDESAGLMEWLMPDPVRLAYRSLLGLSRDCSVESLKILQWLSEPEQPWRINGEVGHQKGDLLLSDSPHGGQRELLRFQRYDLQLPAELDDFVNPDVMQSAYSLAQAAAASPELGVKSTHYPAEFELARQRSMPPEAMKQVMASLQRQTKASPSQVVGVTGHRWNRLPEVERSRISAQIEAVLEEIEGQRSGAITLMTGLAEGTDRIVAAAAISRGWQIVASLPFSKARYEQDFETAASKSEFAAYCAAAAAVFEAPSADRLSDPNVGYAAQGEGLVAAASALITVWDGNAPHGSGGTAEVIARALTKGIPVYWISTVADADMVRL
jgi:hypothetical protein